MDLTDLSSVRCCSSLRAERRCRGIPAQVDVPRWRAGRGAVIGSSWLVLVLALGCGDDAEGGDTANANATTGATDTASSGGSGLGEGTGGAGSTGGETAADDTGEGTGGATDCATPTAKGCPVAPGAMPTEVLEGLLADGAVVPVDARAEAEFLAAHIPGASRIDPSALRAEIDGIGGQVAPPDVAQAVFEAAGVQPSDPIVVYGAGNGTGPARVVWTLAYYGHTGPVWMLDGGFDQWSLEERVVATQAPAGGPSSYPVVVEPTLRVDAPWVLGRLEDPTVTLVDARSPGEFDAGHIPGAVSVNWTTNLGADGLFLEADVLRALYGDPVDGQTLVVYCQTGSRASVDWLVLAMLGYDDVRMYDGSWSEWSTLPDYPQEM